MSDMPPLINKPAFLALLCFAVLIHLCGAWFSEGHYHADEHFQILEPASYKLGVTSEREFKQMHAEQFRSGFMPLVGFAVGKALMTADSYSPFVLAFLLRLLSAALALFATCAFFAAHRERLPQQTHFWTFAAMLLLWPLVLFHLRFSSEGWAVSFLLLGLACLAREPAPRQKALLLAAGAMFGFAFLARYQVAFGLVGLGAWLLWRRRWACMAWLVAGGLPVLAAGALADFWLYGEFVLSWLNYADYHLQNPGQAINKWHSYFSRSFALLPPASFFIFPLVALWLWRERHDKLAWLVAAYLVFHFAVPNKQPRFMILIAPFLPFMAAVLWGKYEHALRPRLRRGVVLCLKTSLVVNMLALPYPALFPVAAEVAAMRKCVAPRKGEFAALVVRERDERAANMPFYTQGIPLIIIQDERELPALAAKHAPKGVWYAARKNRAKQLAAAGLPAAPACQALPAYLTKININNWTARASIWRAHHIRPQ